MTGKVGRPKKQPPMPLPVDRREDWQKEQAARCGCGGCDDYCPCQNAREPWKYGLGPRPSREGDEADRGALSELVRAAKRFVECSTRPGELSPYVAENGRIGTRSPWAELCDAVAPAEAALAERNLGGDDGWPTDEMVEAGVEAWHAENTLLDDTVRRVFRAMVALAPPLGGGDEDQGEEV